MPWSIVNKYFASRLDGNTCFLTEEITIKKIPAGKSAEKGNETSALLMEVESFLCYRGTALLQLIRI